MTNNLTTKVTAKEYLKKIIDFHFKKNQSMPAFNWLMEKMLRKIHISKERLNGLLDELVDDKFLTQKEGVLYINPNRNFSRKESNLKNEEKNNPVINESKQPNEKKPKKITDKLKSIKLPKFSKREKDITEVNNWIIPLKIILFIIGIGAVYMSIFYSYKWLLDFLDPFRAFILALIMVCFAVSAFELIILFRQRKQFILVVVFSALWIVVTLFSMVSTVAGQYNARMKSLNDRYEKETKHKISNRKYLEYIEQKKEYQDTLKMLRQDNIHHQQLLSNYNKKSIEEDRKTYNAIYWRHRQIKININRTTKLLSQLRNKKSKDKIIKKTSPDFYMWISGLFFWGPGMIQFWLSVFPALFIDIISPLAFAIIMFIKS